MANYRRGRINDEVRNEMAEILRGVKDPRVSDAFISVTAAEVTPDLKFAKIYYSHLYGDAKEIAKGLKSSTGYIRHMLAQNLNLRITPDLMFIPDESIVHGAHIASIINNLKFSDKNTEENKTEDENGCSRGEEK
jgi:ribosome-binding factor A